MLGKLGRPFLDAARVGFLSHRVRRGDRVAARGAPASLRGGTASARPPHPPAAAGRPDNHTRGAVAFRDDDGAAWLAENGL